MTIQPPPSQSLTGQTPLPGPIPPIEDIGPLVGHVFGGYEIASYIGEGPTGAVYRGEDLTGARVAVKVLHRELSRGEVVARVRADFAKLAQTKSPHLLPILDSGVGEDQLFFYVTDELAGSDLDAGLTESGALAPKKALEILLGVLRGLEAAHAVGVIHAAIKPHNIFLAEELFARDAGPTGISVKLLDFGVARHAGSLDRGVVIGNPFYMAPEQFGGRSDARSDVYAVGVLAYELFSGALPFGGSHGQAMMRHLGEAPAPPPGVDEPLARIILGALSKSPSARPASATLLRQALERWAASKPSLLLHSAKQHVILRAEEARSMKAQARRVPDATAPMPKVDLAELNHELGRLEQEARAEELPRATNVTVSGSRESEAPNSSKESQNMVGTPPRDKSAPPPRADKNGADANESVEASLEDFINQANASFHDAGSAPPAVNDGWDLHTGDVELIDDDGDEDNLEAEEHVSAPVKVKGVLKAGARAPAKAQPAVVAKPQPAAPAPKQTQKQLAAVAAPAPAPAAAPPALSRVAKQTVKGLPAINIAPLPPIEEPAVPEAAETTSPGEPAMEAQEEEAPAEEAPRPARAAKAKPTLERTEVVSAPLPRVSQTQPQQMPQMPWTANPLVLIGGILTAFVIGCLVVFFLVKNLSPQQPVMVQAPPIVVPAQPVVAPVAPVAAPAPVAVAPVAAPVPLPAPAPAPSAAPVVTPLPSSAPVVTPLGNPAPAAAPVPLPTGPTKKQPVARKAKPAAERPAPAEKPAKADKPIAEKPAKKAAASEDKPVAEKPAKKAEKKSEAKGADWVDPF